MRQYRYASRAARDARAERRMERAAELGPCIEPRDDARQPGRLLLQVNGRTIDIELRPDPRDVRMWRAWRDGHPWLCELAEEDGSTRTMIVQENPDGLRFNDIGEPSPFRVTPLYSAPPKREPLTREDMWLLPSLRGWFPHDHYRLEAVIREVERAHGIGDG